MKRIKMFKRPATFIKCPLEIGTVSPETQCQNELREPLFRCRHALVFVLFLQYVLLCAYRMNVTVGMVEMVNNSTISQDKDVTTQSCPNLISNATAEGKSGEEGEFSWSPEIQGYIQGSYFLCYTVSQIPSGRIVERFGCKWFLFGSSLLTSVSNFLIPALAWISAPALIAVQALRGLMQGIIQPASFALASNWFPKLERGLSISVITSGMPLGCCLGSLFSGLLCASLGRWPSVFYTFGTVGLVVSALVAFFMYENPEDHPRISDAEFRYILSNQESKLSKKRPKLPWRHILTSVKVYALMCGFFGNLWAISMFLTVQSTFLGTILHYSIAENGLLTALSFALQFVAAQFGGWLSSYILQKNLTSVDFIRKFWNSLSSLGFSACLLGVYFSGCDQTLSTTFGVLSLGFNGLGFTTYVVPSDMTSTFAGTLNALCLAVGSMPLYIIPLIVGYLTDGRQTIEQWNKVFLFSTGVVLLCALVFAVFGSADVQPWNYVQEESAEEKIVLKVPDSEI